mmetsp:Transcript_6126/g.12512  ORF Transcript_6126/g.12512 Transcript_6126/m.12512 type:complete len:106 (+) Transcript_6126:1272-1589(+)
MLETKLSDHRPTFQKTRFINPNPLHRTVISFFLLGPSLLPRFHSPSRLGRSDGKACTLSFKEEINSAKTDAKGLLAREREHSLDIVMFDDVNKKQLLNIISLSLL